jgi:hypothetical protein
VRQKLESAYQYCTRASRKREPLYLEGVVQLSKLLSSIERVEDIPEWLREEALGLLLGLLQSSLRPERLRRNDRRRNVRLANAADIIRQVQSEFRFGNTTKKYYGNTTEKRDGRT